MCVGKWHLGSTAEYLPTSRGFDSYFGVPYSVDMRPLPMIENNTVIEENTDRALLTPRYTEAAVRFIESSSPKPFFLYMAHSYPHIPIDASPRFKGKSQQGIYGDAVEEIDWSVGEILHSLKRNHLEENTLVIFTGDHGPWYQGSPGTARGRKGTTYEGGCRVPFLARWKGAIPAGHVNDESAWNFDLLPTIASMCGADLPSEPLDGADISGLLSAGQGPARRDPILYFSAMRGGFDLHCARLGRWKLRISQYTRETYILGSDPGENLLLAKPELYDLDNDPNESYDVAGNHPEIVTQLQRQIEQMIPTFPERVVRVYDDLKKHPDSPTTPPGASARPASYIAVPSHFD
jgi:arylsulfatase